MKRVTMMLATLALFGGASTIPMAAYAADAPAATPAPLRHMVFNITVGIRTVSTTQGSGIGTDTGTNASGSGVAGSGIITANVLAPTADGGLILEISEEAQERKAPPTRVAVRATGEVLTPPNANITDEERILLRYLARGIVALRGPVKGSTWDYDSDAGGTKLHTSFRVVDARDNGMIDIDVDENSSGSGGRMSGTSHGRVVYDTKKSVPDKVDISTRLRQEGVGGLVTTTITFTADLRDDSFAAAK